MSIDPMYLPLGEEIRKARIKKGLILEEVSVRSGLRLTKSALSKIEKGGQQVYVHQLLKLASILDLDIDQILSDIRRKERLDKDVGEVSSKMRSYIHGL